MDTPGPTGESYEELERRRWASISKYIEDESPRFRGYVSAISQIRIIIISLVLIAGFIRLIPTATHLDWSLLLGAFVFYVYIEVLYGMRSISWSRYHSHPPR